MTFDSVPGLPPPAPPPPDRRASIQLVRRVREHLGRRHGGTWYTLDGDGRPAYFFAVTDLRPEDDEWADRLSRADVAGLQVRLVGARYPRRRLLEFYEVITKRLAEQGVTGVGLGIRSDVNRVVASVANDRPDLARSIRSWVPQDAVLVQAVDPNARGWTLFAPLPGRDPR